MDTITFEENERTLEALQNGYDRMSDLFIYGDKERGIKPGNIQVYGKKVGIREVAKERQALREKMLSGGEKER